MGALFILLQIIKMYFQSLKTAVLCLSGVTAAAKLPFALRDANSDVVPTAPTAGQVQQELGPQLSTGATMYFPASEQYDDATSRWNIYGQPNISVVVEVATADDVATVVKYANLAELPFIAVNRGHGSPFTLSGVQNGIQIWLNQLTDITISEDGESAVMGGGVYVEQVIGFLAEQGKASATGACGCVGNTGAGLGGGHGRLQGFFGLVLDNFISLDVVLWNGTQITVSDESYPDLFWGFRGAGHNFGIVTSFNYKVYDQPAPVWFLGKYSFTQDQLENIFDEMNRQSEATLPMEMGLLLLNYAWDTTVSTTEPVLILTINYAGDSAAASAYADPFKAFNPVATMEELVPYEQVANASGTGLDSALCGHGTQRMQFAADLLTYNATTSRELYDLFRDVSVAKPEFRGTILVFESYSVQGIKAVDPDTTAYPHRGDNIIWTQVIQYDYNPSLDAEAIAWGEQARSIAHAGQEPGADLNVYVNYAFGSETLESMYGYEPWRLAKLRDLKSTWDPHGKFNYYMPIS